MFKERNINWLVVFTIFATAFIFFRTPFEFYLLYVPVLFLLPYFIVRYSLSRTFIAIMILLGLSGLYGLSVGTNTTAEFLKTYISIFFVYAFYYYAFAYNQFTIDKLFILYTRFSYVVALIGIFQLVSFWLNFVPGFDFHWFLNKWTLVTSSGYLRVNSIISEPSQLAFVLTPVLFISMYNLMNKQPFFFSKAKSYLFIIISVLTFSTHAYITLILSIAFILLRRISIIKTLTILTCLYIAFSYIYANFPLVRTRVDDSFLIVNKYDKIHDPNFIRTLNSSSFTLLNNFVVAVESFKKNLFIGGGLGSHPVSFDKYSLTREFKLQYRDFNKADANSLLLRLISETGILGVAIFLIILIRFRYNDATNMYRWIISNSILVMMIAGLLREGHYYHSGVPFFLFAYIFNYKQGKKEMLDDK
jgi:hypothetical protein